MSLLPTAVRTPDCYLLQPTVPGFEVPGAARSSTARRAGGGGARIPTRHHRRGWGSDSAHDTETGISRATAGGLGGGRIGVGAVTRAGRVAWG